MSPHELVDAILKQRGLSPYAAARAMNRPSFQPTLHKFLHGQIASPTHQTAKRIADFCKVPIDAMYDSAAATLAARELGLGGSDASAQLPPGAREPVPMYRAQKVQQLPAETVSRIAALPVKQFKALCQMIHVYLDSVAPEAEALSGKRQQG